MSWSNYNGPSIGVSQKEDEEALFYAKQNKAKDLYFEENRGNPSIKPWGNLTDDERIPYLIRVSEMNSKTHGKK